MTGRSCSWYSRIWILIAASSSAGGSRCLGQRYIRPRPRQDPDPWPGTVRPRLFDGVDDVEAGLLQAELELLALKEREDARSVWPVLPVDDRVPLASHQPEQVEISRSKDAVKVTQDTRHVGARQVQQ